MPPEASRTRRSRAPVGFTLKQLRYFVAVCEAGSILLAAEAAHVSSSTMSSQVAQLERLLGVQLLIRQHGQGVAPTGAGEEFARRARELLAQAEALEQLGLELAGEVTGRLRLGCLVTLAPSVGVLLCRGFADEHPRVRIQLVDRGQDELLRGLRGGALELALTYDLELGPDIEFDHLRDLPPRAVLPARHPLVGRSAVDLGELASEPLVLLDLPLSRQYFLELFRGHGIEPRIGAASPHPEVVRGLVANRFGYTLVNVPPPAADGLAVVPLAGQHRAMRLGLARVAGTVPTRTAAAFGEHCRAAAAQVLDAEEAMPGAGSRWLTAAAAEAENPGPWQRHAERG